MKPYKELFETVWKSCHLNIFCFILPIYVKPKKAFLCRRKKCLKELGNGMDAAFFLTKEL